MSATIVLVSTQASTHNSLVKTNHQALYAMDPPGVGGFLIQNKRPWKSPIPKTAGTRMGNPYLGSFGFWVVGLIHHT